MSSGNKKILKTSRERDTAGRERERGKIIFKILREKKNFPPKIQYPTKLP